MGSCAPNDLAKAARCFTCLTPEVLGWVKTYLLCKLANNDPNLIPAGANYAPVLGTYSLTGLTAGKNYRILWGPTEALVTAFGGQIIFNPGAGKNTIAAAQAGGILAFATAAGGGATPVTAQVFAV